MELLQKLYLVHGLKFAKQVLRASDCFFFLLEHFHRWMKKVTLIPACMAQFKKCWHHQNIVFVKAQQYFIFLCVRVNVVRVVYNMLKINGLLQVSELYLSFPKVFPLLPHYSLCSQTLIFLAVDPHTKQLGTVVWQLEVATSIFLYVSFKKEAMQYSIQI